MLKTRLALPVLATTTALTIVGCGSGDSGSGSDLASVAPPDAPVFIEATLRPTGSLKENVESIASQVGIPDPGGTIAEEIEESAREDGEPFDFEEDVEPWLGERAAIFLNDYDGDDFQAGAPWWRSPTPTPPRFSSTKS
jgi:hypothetical protein